MNALNTAAQPVSEFLMSPTVITDTPAMSPAPPQASQFKKKKEGIASHTMKIKGRKGVGLVWLNMKRIKARADIRRY